MITVGVDAHKAIHVAVAVNEAGRELGEWRGPNTSDAWASLARWAATFGSDCWWGIEGAWGNGRGLAQYLVAGGFTVFEISPHWTPRLRRSNRRQGKADRLDARAVARCVREEAPKLPLVQAEDDSVHTRRARPLPDLERATSATVAVSGRDTTPGTSLDTTSGFPERGHPKRAPNRSDRGTWGERAT